LILISETKNSENCVSIVRVKEREKNQISLFEFSIKITRLKI
jgi:hypothetical protein